MKTSATSRTNAPPHSIAAGAGFQAAVVIIAPVVLSAIIIARAAQPAGELPDFGSPSQQLLISGVSTVLQAVRVGANRGRARARHGHLRCLHRSLYHSTGAGADRP